MDSSQHHALSNVTSTVLHNLEDQHDWTSLTMCTIPGLERPLISGRPPRLLYLHPDDQIKALVLEKATGKRTDHETQVEWVLPVRLVEKWTLAKISAVFDVLPEKHRAKRIVLATLDNDSTVVYYLIHEGIIKPRQN